MESKSIDIQLIRLEEYKKKHRLTADELANLIDVTVHVLYKLFQGKLKLQPEISKKIGQLIEKDNPHANNKVQEEKGIYNYKKVEEIDTTFKVPYYDIDVTAGNVQLFQENNQMPADYYTVPKEIQDVDFCFKVRGDSMYDKILPGAIVFVKQIMDISVIDFGQVFIIITEEQRMVKYVRRHPTRPDDMVLLKSHNNHYDDIDLPKEKITNLLLVKGYLNNYVL
jgi:phage repressor protein C with HTH and peptisase S24 domain